MKYIEAMYEYALRSFAQFVIRYYNGKIQSFCDARRSFGIFRITLSLEINRPSSSMSATARQLRLLLSFSSRSARRVRLFRVWKNDGWVLIKERSMGPLNEHRAMPNARSWYICIMNCAQLTRIDMVWLWKLWYNGHECVICNFPMVGEKYYILNFF